MKCIVCLFVIATILFPKTRANDKEEFVCREGMSYVENDCNDCFCAADGKFGCTLKACVVPGQKARTVNCTVGTTFQRDCNKCWCVNNQGVICTNEECHH